MRVGNFGDFNLAVNIDRQTAKFSSPPNFPAIWYIILYEKKIDCLVQIHIIIAYIKLNASLSPRLRWTLTKLQS